MTYFSKIFVIKPGQEKAFLSWLMELEERKAEAVATFAYEGITSETIAMFHGKDNRTYVLITNEAEQEPRPGDPSVAINQEHRRVKEQCLEVFTGPANVAVHFKAQ